MSFLGLAFEDVR